MRQTGAEAFIDAWLKDCKETKEDHGSKKLQACKKAFIKVLQLAEDPVQPRTHTHLLPVIPWYSISALIFVVGM